MAKARKKNKTYNGFRKIGIEIVVFADYTVLFLLRLSFTGSTDDIGTLPPQVWHLGIESTAFRPRKYIALNIGSTEKNVTYCIIMQLSFRFLGQNKFAK